MICFKLMNSFRCHILSLHQYSAKETLIFFQKTSYHLKIKVEDGNWEVQSRAVIAVLDVNDNRPKFSSPQYNFKMSSSSSFDPTQNATIGKVEASDADGKEFGQITYLIEDNPYLTVDADTGELRLISAPRYTI